MQNSGVKSPPDAADGNALHILTVFVGLLAAILIAIVFIVILLLEQTEKLPLNCLLFFAAIVLLLILSALTNDALISGNGRKAVAILTSAFGLLGSLQILFFVQELKALGFIIIAAAICLLALTWGSILCRLNSKVLIALLMSCCVLAGTVVFCLSIANKLQILVLLSTLFLVTGVSAFISIRRQNEMFYYQNEEFATRKQSKERHLCGKGNCFALLLVGMLMGASAIFLRKLNLNASDMSLAVGTSLLIVGLLIALLYRTFQSVIGDACKRTLALGAALGMIPFPFLNSKGQLLCVCLLLIVGTLNLILIIDAILETARFNQISPTWLIGCEGAEFFAGVLATIFLSYLLQEIFPYALEITIYLLVLLSSVLQVLINNQVYPIFAPRYYLDDANGVSCSKNKIQLHSTSSNTDSNIDSNVNASVDTGFNTKTNTNVDISSAFWRSRIDMLASKYKLSLRQKEIMVMLVKGRSLSYITNSLKISQSTAKTHIANLYYKMDVHSKQDIIDIVESASGTKENNLNEEGF
ncbi:MAG: helix-turn-helix transcriptional regulator [Coriobacteriales bacterium]|jgi:DNA-binding CsgD family transcriptional regulator|nr:helix-turn-helix transcriptional regulator [Coriobacteriales bacterium]